MREVEIHKAFAHWLDSEKLLYLHSRTDKRTTVAVGDPDFCICRAGRCLFVELKVPGNHLSEVQVVRIADLRSAGNRVEVCYSLDDAVEAVRAWRGDEAVRSSAWLGAWVECKERLPQSGRVLVFSPLYKVGDPTRFRVMNAQFVRISKDCTHWMDLDAIAPNIVPAAPCEAAAIVPPAPKEWLCYWQNTTWVRNEKQLIRRAKQGDVFHLHFEAC